MSNEEMIKELESWCVEDCEHEEFEPCIDCNEKCKTGITIAKSIEALKFQQEYQDRIQKCIERIEKATTICPIGTIVNFSLVNRGESWKDFRYY